MKNLRIALAQINTTVGDLTGNRRKILSYIRNSSRQAADLVVFPELSTAGYPPEDLLLKPKFVSDNLKSLQEIAKSVTGIAAIVGFVDRDKKGKLYNAAALIENRKAVSVYRKMLLPNYGVFDEKRYFAQGDKPAIFRLKDTSFGINICEDIWEREGPASLEAHEGAEVLINISASPYHAGKGSIRQKMLSGRASDNSVYIVYVNLVGGQDELVFDGHSLVFDKDGDLVAQGRQFEEDLLFVDLARPKRPAIAGKIADELEQEEEIYRALVLGTRDYIRKNNFKKVAIGISGGIDSALTATIAVDAIGKENVVGVTMPSTFSSKATQRDSQILAKNLGIKLITIPIQQIFERYLNSLSREFRNRERGLAEENLQARVRGNLLMALSNKFGWLVLTTGNKSETSTGYCTLYGDTAGGFAVLKDVYKTEVYRLSLYKNRTSKKPLIPSSIIERPPTAELKPNQLDQDTLPPYEVLDAILKFYVEDDLSPEDIARRGFNMAVVKKVVRMVDMNEYKRRQAPPGVKITPRAFGKDRRMPITNAYKLY